MQCKKELSYFILILLGVMLASGCTGRLLSFRVSPATQTPDFVMVTASPQDTLASLARTYLKDEEKAWQIGAYNRIDALTPGEQVIIPLTPLNYGGLKQDGYQLVPVLRYPELTSRSSGSNAVQAAEFISQMQYLNENGYATVSLDQFHAFLNFKGQLPPGAVVVTFDSTRRWVYEIAFPALKSRGMKAAVFVHLKEIGARGGLTWAQLAEMASSGFDIGLYGSEFRPPDQNKPMKTYLEAVEKEFTAPQLAFRINLKRPCRYFAYPAGTSNDLAIAMLKKNGFRAAFTRRQGGNPFFTNNYKIKRTTIYADYDLNQFRQTLMTFESERLR